MTTTLSVPATGDVLAGKYVLREHLGTGGMGVVFRAEHSALGRSVAIKILHSKLIASEWSLRKLADEVIAASRVKHPGAVSVIDCDLLGDAPFLVMEHVQGRPLSHLIAGGELPVPRALAITDQLLDVLEAAHAAGVIHADVKSNNVLVERRADRDIVTLVDFGLACLDGAWIETEEVLGTPGYMAPELVRGAPPTATSDLYGVAVILYEMLTGVPPFAGKSSLDIFMRHLHDPVPPPSARRQIGDLSAAVDAIVLRALAKDPCERFASARELQLALRSVATSAAMREALLRYRCPRCGAETGSVTDRCGRCGALVRVKPALAHGSEVQPIARPDDGTRGLRAAIARALIAGDVAAIASGYVALADALVREQCLAAAFRELEEGIDMLTAGSSEHAREGQLLVAALATLSRR